MKSSLIYISEASNNRYTVITVHCRVSFSLNLLCTGTVALLPLHHPNTKTSISI